MRSLKNLVILRRLVEQFRLTWQLMRDPRTPTWAEMEFHRRVAFMLPYHSISCRISSRSWDNWTISASYWGG